MRSPRGLYKIRLCECFHFYKYRKISSSYDIRNNYKCSVMGVRKMTFLLTCVVSKEVFFMLLEDALKEYLYDCQLRKLSPRTMKSIKNNNLGLFRYLANTLMICELEDVKRIHIQEFVNYLSLQGRKETYVNSMIKSFRGLFRYCEDEEYIKTSPVAKVKFQKEEIPVITTFNNEEVRRMVEHFSGKHFLEQRNKLLITVLFDSGIRNAELCDIQMEDIHDNAIKIRGKGKKIRYVPLTPSINKALIKYLRVRSNYILDKHRYQTEYLFLSQKGKRLTPEAVEYIVKECGRACKIRSEIRCSPHTCRHYYAQTQLKNGCDLYTVSRLLGHNNINITKRYLYSMGAMDILEIAQKTSPLKNL